MDQDWTHTLVPSQTSAPNSNISEKVAAFFQSLSGMPDWACSRFAVTVTKQPFSGAQDIEISVRLKPKES